MSYDIEALRKLSGTNARGASFIYKTPSIKIDGNTGVVVLEPIYEKGVEKPDTPLQFPLNVVILKETVSYTGWKKGSFVNGVKQPNTSYSSNETEYDGPIAIWEKCGDKKTKIFEGIYSDVYEKCKVQLKPVVNVYVLYDNQIVKLVAKGTGRKNYFAYKKNLRAEKKDIFLINTSVDKVFMDEGIKHYGFTFTATSAVSPDTIGPYLEEASTNVNKMLEDGKKRFNKPKNQAQEELPVINVDDDVKEGHINVDEIPF